MTCNMKVLKIFLLSYSEYCEISLNILMDDCHLSNITKLWGKKTMRNTLQLFSFSYLFYSQIWLNFVVDGCDLVYNIGNWKRHNSSHNDSALNGRFKLKTENIPYKI